MSELPLPVVNSVWRKGDEWRKVHRVEIDGCVSYWDFENEGPVLSPPQSWQRWSRDAVCVWSPGQQASEPTVGTVRVRAAVAIELDRRGEPEAWHVLGRQDDDHDVVGDVLSSCWLRESQRHIAWITADIPIPTIPTITASVVPDDERD